MTKTTDQLMRVPAFYMTGWDTPTYAIILKPAHQNDLVIHNTLYQCHAHIHTLQFPVLGCYAGMPIISDMPTCLYPGAGGRGPQSQTLSFRGWIWIHVYGVAASTKEIV